MEIPHWEAVHTIAFDFDGIFTDNKVFLNQDGIEAVCCNRGDGLGFDLLRNFIGVKNWEVSYFILSKEGNPVVSRRADKLRIPCIQSVSDKACYLVNHLAKENKDRRGLIYLGNDLNDLAAMQIAGFSVAPSDSHPLIAKQADLILEKKGGDGFVREFIELLIGVNKLSHNELVKLL